ncbi:MAG TPA: hypothetical protein VFQ91_18770 [Bryobacteraceae bacterium]|nr:hypothetical protein [Bryobacteraceae bacterium]
MNQPKAAYGAFRPGTILIDKTSTLPESLPLGTEIAGTEWVGIHGDPDHRQLESLISAAGWRFFFLAHSIKTSAFGFDRCNALQRATQRLIRAVKGEKFNALEIVSSDVRSFWGIRYATLSAHPRHIQVHMVLGSKA